MGGIIMINFIIVDDKYIWLDQISAIIDKIMIKTNFEYTKATFSEYDKSFNKYINHNLENKIYILDIRTNKRNGIDIAREIRKNDNEAIIIFLTAYEKYGNKILKSMLGVYGMISKNENVAEILEESIIEILNKINNNPKIIKIKDTNSICAIPLSSILYMTVATERRRTIINTDIRSIECKKTLKYFENEYANILTRTHKSCLVNINRVIDFDFKEHKIYFNNKNSVELLSKKYKNKIEEKIFK